MPITLVGSATAYTGNTQNPSVNRPSGVQAGDLLVIFATTYTNQYLTKPNDWTSIFSEFNTAIIGLACYKVAGASEPESYTLTSTGTGGKCLICTAWRGVDNTTPVHKSATGTTARTSPTVTPTVDGCMILPLAGGAVRQATTFSAPSNGTQASSINSTTGTNASCQAALAYYEQATAGETGTTTWTAGTIDYSKNATVALLPAASTGQPILTRPRLLNSALLQWRLVR